MPSPLFPTTIMARTDLSDAAKVVAIAILWHVRPADDRMTCWPSNRRLAEMTGKTIRTVQRRILELEAAGVVQRPDVSGVGRRILEVVPDSIEPETTNDMGTSQVTRGGVTDDMGGVSPMSPIRKARKKGKEESPHKPPHGGISEKVDEVLSAFNDVAGRDYRTGPKRSKAHARLITARLKQEVEASGGDMDQAATRAVLLVRCYQEKWGDDPKMCDYVRPSTLFQAAKWADRMDDTRRWVTGRNGR